MGKKGRSFFSVGFAAALAGAAYFLKVRPWLLTWGAEEDDLRGTLPGDELVQSPLYESTRAVTIQAPASRVWPWLVQMGQGRGGLYSYDWLENLLNLDIHSTDRILPEFQNLKVGDKVRLMPPDEEFELAFDVHSIEPERALVLVTQGSPEENFESGLPYGSWTFVLEPVGPETTRLVVRLRSDYRPDFAGVMVNQVLLEPVHFIMERRMLLGIQERAEALDRAAPEAYRIHL